MAHHLKSTLWTYTLFKKYLQTYLPCQRWPAVQYRCPDRTRCAHYQSPHQYQRDPPFPPVAVCAHSRVPAMHKSIKINWHISAIDAFHVSLSHSQFAVLSMRGAHQFHVVSRLALSSGNDSSPRCVAAFISASTETNDITDWSLQFTDWLSGEFEKGNDPRSKRETMLYVGRTAPPTATTTTVSSSVSTPG